ncbi:DUF4232 domain-containing protein [Streptomyces sp. NPDC058257]|uniref:DUF4232 domain-containing protein n=1 Tax=Streptomyces sp. NPDC058257 TaxID=3346409 RepID=UPI0036E70647
MRAKTLTLAAVALAASLSLTACQGDEDSAASGSGSGSGSGNGSGASSSSSSASASSSSSSSSSPGSSDGNDKATGGESAATESSGQGSGGGQVTTGNCKTANLTFSSSHGMGEGDLLVSIKNTGGDACTLKGFPGVDLKADSGPGGISAERSELAAPAVALKGGETTRFTLHTPRNDTGGSGLDITTIVVTPPNETHSKTLPVSLNVPVSDKAVATVTVDPVGTGKQ